MARSENIPPYVTADQDRHGKVRYRFRRKGFKSAYINHPLGTPEFDAEYNRLVSGQGAASVEIGVDRTKPRSISELIARYYQSAEFEGLAPSSQKTYRGILERFRAVHGDKLVANLTRVHVEAILKLMKRHPSAAANLKKRLNALMEYAFGEGWIFSNPVSGARVPKPAQKSTGFHNWTDGEIAFFRSRYAIGTRERTAFELMLNLLNRRSDAVRIGPANIQDGRIVFVPYKTRRQFPDPIHIKMTGELKEAIAHIPDTASHFILTSHGKPFTAPGFGNWFRDVCDAIGLEHCTSHGLRKAKARQLAEKGRTANQLMAAGGWRNLKSVQPYIEAADQKRLGDQALSDDDV